ncbi:MAG: HEAT repeat domain-containing protein, partial [Thermoanaerobaculia bacterium]
AKVAEALRFAGIRVGSVYDLVNSRQSYPSAIPILIRMLHEVQHPRIKEGIARALTVKEARDVAGELVREFRGMRAETGPEMSAKWAIGNALAVAGSDEVADDVIVLMEDPRHGWSRSMLPLALAHAKKRRETATQALLRSLSDDQLACAAASALAKLKVPDAIEPLQALAKHDDKDIRKAAASALKRLQKS